MVKVKICGITNEDDALAAARADADFLGYNFAQKSFRRIETARAAAIVSRLKAEFPAVRHIGVFVDQDLDDVADTCMQAGLEFAQLHGSESPSFVSRLRERNIEAIKAIRFGTGADAVPWKDFPVPHFLCDSFDPAAAGGTGRMFEHSLIPPDFPLAISFIAGGLTPVNVAQVVRELRPFGVDVASRVELSPGRKSHELVREFIRRAKSMRED